MRGENGLWAKEGVIKSPPYLCYGICP